MDAEKKFVEAVLKAIVTTPSEVKVVRSSDEIGALLTVTVNKADMARIIGRQGQTAKAIRHLLRVVGFNNNTRATMKIVDPIKEI